MLADALIAGGETVVVFWWLNIVLNSWFNQRHRKTMTQPSVVSCQPYLMLTSALSRPLLSPFISPLKLTCRTVMAWLRSNLKTKRTMLWRMVKCRSILKITMPCWMIWIRWVILHQHVLVVLGAKSCLYHSPLLRLEWGHTFWFVRMEPIRPTTTASTLSRHPPPTSLRNAFRSVTNAAWPANLPTAVTFRPTWNSLASRATKTSVSRTINTVPSCTAASPRYPVRPFLVPPVTWKMFVRLKRLLLWMAFRNVKKPVKPHAATKIRLKALVPTRSAMTMLLAWFLVLPTTFMTPFPNMWPNSVWIWILSLVVPVVVLPARTPFAASQRVTSVLIPMMHFVRNTAFATTCKVMSTLSRLPRKLARCVLPITPACVSSFVHAQPVAFQQSVVLPKISSVRIILLAPYSMATRKMMILWLVVEIMMTLYSRRMSTRLVSTLILLERKQATPNVPSYVPMLVAALQTRQPRVLTRSTALRTKGASLSMEVEKMMMILALYSRRTSMTLVLTLILPQ